MAVPKRRQSHQRTNKRRSHHSLKERMLSLCKNCKEPKLPHRICKNCGFYGDRQIVEKKEI